MSDIIAAAARRTRKIALLLVLLGALVVMPSQQAHAFPPAGSENVQVMSSVNLTSRLGQETIIFSGSATISRSDPYMDGGVEVVDLELISLALGGNSITGPVTITQSSTIPSLGEIRSNQAGQSWPASAYLDIFIDVGAPASPNATITKHNEAAIHVVPMFQGSSISISSWPPSAVPWEADLTPCVSLLPTDPKDVCVTSLSLVLIGTNSGEVGGLAELASIGGVDASLSAADRWSAPQYVLAASLAAGVAVLGAAWLLRRKLAT